MVMLNRKAMLAASGTAFSPDQIGGLQLWLQGSTVTGVDGAAVSSWVDSSANAHEATQATGGNQPTVQRAEINGHDTMLFDGSDDYLSIADHNSLDLVAPFAIYVAARFSSVANWRHFLTKAAAYAVGAYQGRPQLSIIGKADLTAALAWVTQDQTILLGYELDASLDATLYVNGHPKETVAGASDPNVNANALQVGGAASVYFGGDLGEVVAFNSIPTATERGQIFDYLAGLYGITIPNIDPDPATAAKAAAPLTTPTYDGSGEAVHPDVYDAGAGNTWNGYRYWMAITPYPAGDNSYENPSILVSADGDTWSVPAGLTNPIEPAPATGNNADPDLIMIGDTLYCIWLHYYDAGATTTETIYEQHSTDGITWSDKVQIFQAAQAGISVLSSPAVVAVAGEYRMYVADRVNNKITYYTADSITGPWNGPNDCTLVNSYGAAPGPYHLDVIRVGNSYCMMLVSGINNYFATSNDGVTWFVDRAITLAGGGAVWDYQIYRSTLVWNGTDFDVWYSANDNGAPWEWRIGRTSITGVTVP